ncbi:MAG TPA: RagB/SusD family nutrient uptake outer membrane protein [Pseudosphingobacterium sp.]|nr:RagB/SusD family nutrient uptake outer membrane protein [Pseudosphingobacterium sp.]
MNELEMLVYAEAQAELGIITQSDIDKTINALRKRVGMSNGLLQLANIPPDPNREFPTLSPILNEIRRERKIELAAEWYRIDDIFCWAAADEVLVGKHPLSAFRKHGKTIPALQSFLSGTGHCPVNAQGYIDPYKPYGAMDQECRFSLKRGYLLKILKGSSNCSEFPNITLCLQKTNVYDS